MALNEAEKQALSDKLNHPSKEVLCPRCGRKLIYEERGNSIAVSCEDPNCIHAGIRGL